MKNVRSKVLFYGLLTFFCVLFFYQTYFLSQSDSFLLLGVFFLQFLIYFFILREVEQTALKTVLFAASIVYLIPLFSIPNLSNDVYRFLWDGKLILAGINPYDFTPNELIEQANFTTDWNLYNGMGALSQENYSCYPTVNQLFFVIPAFFGSNFFLQVIFLRLELLLAAFGSFYLLFLLLKQLKLNTNRIWIFVFNPLVISETVLNLHVEMGMVFFFLLGLFFLQKQRFFSSAIFFACAIHIKLIPLVFLPFLVRYLGFSKAAFVGSLTLLITVLLAFVFIDFENAAHFAQSLTLYFKQFEFNSFVLYWYVQFSEWKYGYNRIQSYGPYLSQLATKFIILFAWYRSNFTFEKMIQRFVFALFVYYMLSSTVHPWYLIFPFALSLFTSYSYVLVWTFLVGFSYLHYANLSENEFRFWVAVEYLTLFSFFFTQVISSFGNSLPKWNLEHLVGFSKNSCR